MDYGSGADTDTGKDGAVGANVNIFPNVYPRGHGESATTLDGFCLGWCLQRVDGHVGPNGCIPPDGDFARVEKLAVRANVDVVADGDVVAVIAHEGRVDVDLTPEVSRDDWFSIPEIPGPPRRKDCIKQPMHLVCSDLHVWVAGVVVTVHGVLAFIALPN